MELEGTPTVEKVPTVEFPFETPSTAQFTSELLTALGFTLRSKGCEVVTLDNVGVRVMDWIELTERIVTLEDPMLLGSDCEMAVTVTVGGMGTRAGAV
jgi:hypothetical protein